LSARPPWANAVHLRSRRRRNGAALKVSVGLGDEVLPQEGNEHCQQDRVPPAGHPRLTQMSATCSCATSPNANLSRSVALPTNGRLATDRHDPITRDNGRYCRFVVCYVVTFHKARADVGGIRPSELSDLADATRTGLMIGGFRWSGTRSGPWGSSNQADIGGADLKAGRRLAHLSPMFTKSGGRTS
jgi:hypothetical protein